ncbi:MAG: hypothetical protein ABI369_13655 [Acetobacteraceae bacterium]
MILSRLCDWLPGHRPLEPEPAAGVASPAGAGPAIAAAAPVWTAERLAVCDALWGAGFNLPGGEEEVLRLAKPLGLSEAISVLLLGCGAGGAACCLVESLGAWVSGFEADPALVAAATLRCTAAGLGRRAPIEPWDPAAPRFTARHYHHALALEPLRDASAETVLAALAGALRPGSNLVLTEVVEGDPSVVAPFPDWLRVERRRPPPLASSVGVVLESLGFEVRIAEDITQRHVQLMARGWRDLVRGIGAARPSPTRAAHMVAEAELWLLRARLMRAGRVRLMRWHAIARATVGVS